MNRTTRCAPKTPTPNPATGARTPLRPGALPRALALLALTALLTACGGMQIVDPTAEQLRPYPGEGYGYIEFYLLPGDAVIQLDNVRYATRPATAGAWLKGYLPTGRHTVAVSAPGYVTRYRQVDVTEAGWAGGTVYLCRRGVNGLICKD